jgi:tetratricopeptide (TPR) repeat protein
MRHFALNLLAATLTVLTVCAVSTGVSISSPATSPAAQVGNNEPRPIPTPEAALAAGRALVDRFIQHVQTAPNIPDSARKAVADAWAKHRPDEHPEDFLTAALAMVSEPFRQGLQDMEQENYTAAEAAFRPLAAGSDPWISLHSKAALARALIEQDRVEEAQRLLAELAQRRADLADKSFLEAQVDLLAGYCHLANLEYDQARLALERFDRDHPDAPDKYRLPARQMLAELKARTPGSLGEVSDLMVYAGRRLNRGLADPPLRSAQQRAIDLLSQLIKEAEQREKQASAAAAGSGSGRGNIGLGGTPRTPAQQSMLPAGPGQKGELNRRPAARPGEMWGQMRPEDRQRILQSLRESFPSRYRQLVEQYYRQLAKEP